MSGQGTEGQFSVDKQDESALVFVVVGGECCAENLPVDVLDIVRCPLLLLLEIGAVWGEVDFLM